MLLTLECTSPAQVCELSHWMHSKSGTRVEHHRAHVVDTKEPVGCQCFVQPCLV